MTYTERSLIGWFDVRDTIFNAARIQSLPLKPRWWDMQMFRDAFWRALRCDHGDAQWLKKAFGNSIPENAAEAKKTLLKLIEDDFLACSGQLFSFAAMMVPSALDYMFLLENAARLGDGFALAKMASRQYVSEPGIRSAELAAASAITGERDGIFYVALYSGKDPKENFEAYRKAALLGQHSACTVCANQFSLDVPKYYFWCGKAVLSGWRCGNDESSIQIFLEQIKAQLALIGENRGSASIIYQIGEAFKDHRTYEKSVIISKYAPFQRALSIHGRICEHYRAAIVTWLLFAKKVLGRDVRGIIARLVWACRSEAQYVLLASVRLQKKIKSE